MFNCIETLRTTHCYNRCPHYGRSHRIRSCRGRNRKYFPTDKLSYSGGALSLNGDCTSLRTLRRVSPMNSEVDDGGVRSFVARICARDDETWANGEAVVRRSTQGAVHSWRSQTHSVLRLGRMRSREGRRLNKVLNFLAPWFGFCLLSSRLAGARRPAIVSGEPHQIEIHCIERWSTLLAGDRVSNKWYAHTKVPGRFIE